MRLTCGSDWYQFSNPASDLASTSVNSVTGVVQAMTVDQVSIKEYLIKIMTRLSIILSLDDYAMRKLP